MDKDLLARQEVRDLANRAEKAGEILATWSQDQIDALVKALSQCAYENRELLAELACQETGFGNVSDKIQKNIFASQTVYQAIAPLKTVGILAKDDGKKVWDVAVPVGVIGAIVPSTNPTSTVIFKTLIALKSGNPILFSPHPGALQATRKTVEILIGAGQAVGCPSGAISCLTHPTMAGVQELMACPQVKLLLATGGGAMVKAAYSAGKPAIGVGAGNGPAYIHHSADIAQAVAHIVHSKTFDNGVICASEQSVIVEKDLESAVMREMEKQGCFFVSPEDGRVLAKTIFGPKGTMNPKTVGKTALEIAKLAGISVPPTTKILVAKETGVGGDYPYSLEKLCPVLGFYVEENQEAVLAKTCQILHHEGKGHTFTIHCNDVSVVEKFALKVPVSRILVNTPAALGGIGSSTNLFPSLTLGCGAVGGSSSSNNIGPLDLINIKRVAWGKQENLVDQIVDKLYQKFGL